MDPQVFEQADSFSVASNKVKRLASRIIDFFRPVDLDLGKSRLDGSAADSPDVKSIEFAFRQYQGSRKRHPGFGDSSPSSTRTRASLLGISHPAGSHERLGQARLIADTHRVPEQARPVATTTVG
jgi:hypothetical protein